MPTPIPGTDPATLYRQRLAQREAEERRLRTHHIVWGYIRLALVVLFLVLAYLAWVNHALSAYWLLLPFALFIAAARLHARVLNHRAETQRAIAFCHHGLARIEDRWAGLQPRTSRAEASTSLYAADLDLFGNGSLFELLSTARTSLGEDTLAAWLLHPAFPEEISARQSAVQELRAHLDLRETVASRTGDEVTSLDLESLAAWGEATNDAVPRWAPWLAFALFAVTVALAILALLSGPAWPLIAIVVLDAALTYTYLRRIEDLLNATDRIHRSLRLATKLISTLQSATFQTEKLRELQRAFTSPHSAAHALDRLATLAEMADWRRNYILRVLDSPLLYSLHLAGRVQSWRRANGSALRSWLLALGEFEALLSLAAYSFEHPHDAFPELQESVPPHFEADDLGHPLLSAAVCVRNDVALNNSAHLLLVSGSNMSGKSTLLRSVGVTAVMAMAGAPVRAARLRLSPLQIAASIRTNDSLHEGRSRFYAEILRLRDICTLAESAPVLFLLDELLGGTNSVDRLAGAQGIAHALLASGAIGLISTHDLALAEIGTSTEQPVHQVHFEDRIENGETRFDFKLLDGVVERRNGLELMRLVGLKV